MNEKVVVIILEFVNLESPYTSPTLVQNNYGNGIKTR